MQLIIESEPLPLAPDKDGVYRVAGTRVSLDTLVAAYQEGATPEEMVDQYPTVKLDHVYAVIGYYLRHRDDVDAYLSDRTIVAADVRAAAERDWPPQGARDRLMARRSASDQERP